MARSLWLECRNLRAKLNDCGREGALPVVGEERVPRRAGAQRDEITISGAGEDGCLSLSLSLCLSYSLTIFLASSRPLVLSVSLICSLTLSLSHTFSLSHTQRLTLSHSLSLSLYLALSLTHPPTRLTHPLTLTHLCCDSIAKEQHSALRPCMCVQPCSCVVRQIRRC